MADFLTAVRPVRGAREDSGSDSLLTAVGSKSLKDLESRPRTQDGPHEDDELRTERGSNGGSNSKLKPLSRPPNEDVANRPVVSAKEALERLRSEPNLNCLLSTLEQVNSGKFEEAFDIALPGPLQAQIINTVLTRIVPTFWPTLRNHQREALLSTLRNVAGLNAVVARLRLLASQKGSAEGLADLVSIADELFAGDDLVISVQRTLRRSGNRANSDLAWKDFVNVIGSGKVVGAVAQAEDALKGSNPRRQTPSSWLATSSKYCSWLGRSMSRLLMSASVGDEQFPSEDASLLLPRALQLGHSGRLFSALLTTDGLRGEHLRPSIRALPNHAKRVFAEQLLRWLSDTFTTEGLENPKYAARSVNAIGGLLSTLLEGDGQLLEASLCDPVFASSLSLSVRRAILAILSQDSDGGLVQELLEKLVSQFASPIFIGHAPVLHQDGLAQTILLASGYVHRKAPMSLLMTARSSGHMQGVSKRLDSSNVRARWLGMVVGTTISKLVDKPGAQMDFGTDDMRSKDAAWYAMLVEVNDQVGTFEEFQAFLRSQQHETAIKILPSRSANRQPATLDGKPVFGPPRPPAPVQTKIIGGRVTELAEDGSSDEDDDLKPYAKPDSDPEDSDEDATLVNRNRIRAPVYIRDLMAGLRDDKTFDRFNIAIRTAASLIRRKTSFGKEVEDHAEELVGMLCNLQDPFDIDDFDDMRLQALVAVLLSDVGAIAPWLARETFAEGYSIAQRCVVLSALGLGGRELAGFKNEDEDYNPRLSKTNFPSKQLPPHLHAVYSNNEQTKRLEAASKSIEQQVIEPMALQAADQSTAHLNAVKVRSFSSRLEVEKARTKRKPPANELAKCFGERFFFPLANRYQQEIAAYGSGSVYSSAPFLLTTFVKTLALLFHASGPATLGLPQIAAELWDLLLSLRVQAASDISVLQAVLFGLLTLLEVDFDKQRIVQEQPKQLMETQQWVDLIFERMGGGGLVDDGGKGEEAKVRTLAAGVLMKCRDIIEAYQKQLVGYDFS